MSEEEERALVRRIVAQAAVKLRGASNLAERLGIPYSAVRSYIDGEARPDDVLLLRAVNIILDEMPAIRAAYSEETWKALGLPKC